VTLRSFGATAVSKSPYILDISCLWEELWEQNSWRLQASRNYILIAVLLPATKALEGRSPYSFSISELDGGEWSASRPGRSLAPGKGLPGTHCTGGWLGPRAGLDTKTRGKILLPLLGIEPRSLGRQARSQTLYWLSYPAPNHMYYPF
jgi:hypothetical protein